MGEKENILKEQGEKMIRSALKAVDPFVLVKDSLKREDQLLYVEGWECDLKKIKRIVVLGAGKASARMALGVEEILLDKIYSGIVITKKNYSTKLKKIELVFGGHPIPDEDSLRGTKRIIDLLSTAQEEDLVVGLFSGGGSSLLAFPVEKISLEDKRKITDLLLRSGADIEEVNTIRKHISLVKGGRLTRWGNPRFFLSLILSDVIGDPLNAVASGPTTFDNTTFSDCLTILKKYHILDRTPESIRGFLERNLNKKKNETLKMDDPIFKKVRNIIIGSNSLALKKAEEKAKELGFNTLILSSSVSGDTGKAAKEHAELAKRIRKENKPLSPPACVISGGETTVKVKGAGLGGRNQEFVLVSAMEIEGLKDVVIFSINTDGTDGPTDAAGAFCNGNTIFKTKELSLDPYAYLENNDSYHFFEKVGGLINTGPTLTNVMDIHLMLIG
jgi:glycerate 2-kinase